MYSLANIANAYVTTVGQYALWRFVAGFGLAGELGAGITLVTEVLPKRGRGIGTSIVAGVGILGAVVGFEVSSRFDWQQAYLIGGVLGLLLLALRVGVKESGLFTKVQDITSRGDIRVLFQGRGRLRKFLAVVALGIPLWYLVGILVIFSPEFAKAGGLELAVSAAKAVAVCYWGLAIGDVASGFISQALGSRRKAVLGYMVFMVAAVAFYFGGGLRVPALFYPSCFLMGLGGGYWALFVTIGAEQFGTDIRATVATSVPNFVRGAVPVMVWLFLLFKGWLGSVAGSGIALGALVFALSAWGWFGIEETYHKDMDYLEGSPALTGRRKVLSLRPRSPRGAQPRKTGKAARKR
jgi:MFS family permease